MSLFSRQDADLLPQKPCVARQAKRDISHFADCSYCNIKSAGASLAFDGRDAPPTRCLACVHVFAANPKEGYERCTLELPHGLVLGMTGKQLVEAHGEPERKGGGASMGGIFVSYERLGFQANFERPAWEADNPVRGFDIFVAKS
jgi:hypothetical protein